MAGMTYKVYKNHVITVIMTLMLKSRKISNKLGTVNLVIHSIGDTQVESQRSQAGVMTVTKYPC